MALNDSVERQCRPGLIEPEPATGGKLAFFGSGCISRAAPPQPKTLAEHGSVIIFLLPCFLYGELLVRELYRGTSH